jgi:hypothetical protein
MPHPVASLGEADLEQRADELVERVLEALLDARRPAG